MFSITARMSLEQLATFVKHIGLLARWRGKVPPHEYIRILPLGEAAEIFELAANILTDWPGAFHLLVDTLAATSGVSVAV